MPDPTPLAAGGAPPGPPVAAVNATVVILSLAASAVFGLATALQHRASGQTPDAGGLRPRQLAAFVRATVAHPMWLLGVVADVVGLGFHVAALRLGSLVVVQIVLVSGVVFALVAEQAFARRLPRPRQMVWAAALIAGIGLFLAGTGSGGGTLPDPTSPALALASGAVLAVVAVLALASTNRKGRLPAALLGAAAGVSFAGAAALIKASTQLLGRGLGPLVTHWPPYVLVVLGSVGLLCNQLALQAGPLQVGVTVIAVCDPVASVVLGVWALREPLRSDPGAVAALVAGLSVALSAVVALTATRPGPAAAS